MAIPDGKPATDFSAMNREWVRAVAAEAAEGGGGGIPAPADPSDGDVLTYSSTDSAWVAAAPGESEIFVVTISEEESGEDYIYTFSPSIDDIVAAKEDGKLIMAIYAGGNSTYQVDCYKNAADDWGITVYFPSFAVDQTGIHIYIDSYTQTYGDESMTYDSAEGLITAVE